MRPVLIDSATASVQPVGARLAAWSMPAMQCVRCGKVLNREDRRCPNCYASLSNQQIGQMEIAQQQLKEIIAVERAGMGTRYARRGASTGALIGGLGLVASLDPWLVLAGALCGCAIGWFIAWRSWGVFRTGLLYCAAMLPIALIASFNPFVVLAVACTGMLIGWSILLVRH